MLFKLTLQQSSNAWNEERKGSDRHGVFFDNMEDSLIYESHLSSTILGKLLSINTILSGLTTKDNVEEITDRVPRELIKL